MTIHMGLSSNRQRCIQMIAFNKTESLNKIIYK